MNGFTDSEIAQGGAASAPRVRVRMLQQMAEALEDEAAVLYRRAAANEEEDFLLNCEINERQTEINRLLLKLESMRSDRDNLLEKVEAIRNEAAALREEAFNGEEEIALAVIDNSRVIDTLEAVGCESKLGFSGDDKASYNSLYFRRMTLADAG
jgi:predicted RNase H-like nuclease (RuvC/YqgF family)